MSRRNKVPLADHVDPAAEAALAAKSFASATDIFAGIGWLDPGALESWRRGELDCLEWAAQANLHRINDPLWPRAPAFGASLS